MTIQGMITGLKAHRRAAWAGALALMAVTVPATAATAAIRIESISYNFRIRPPLPSWGYYNSGIMTPPMVQNYDEEGNYLGEMQYGEFNDSYGQRECSDSVCVSALYQIGNIAVSTGDFASGSMKSFASVGATKSNQFGSYIEADNYTYVILTADRFTELTISGSHTTTGRNFQIVTESVYNNRLSSSVSSFNCCLFEEWIDRESFSFKTRFLGTIFLISHHTPVVQVNDPGAAASTNTLFWTATTVPEPGTWALMIAGFGMAGGALRSQRRRGASQGGAWQGGEWQGGAPA